MVWRCVWVTLCETNDIRYQNKLVVYVFWYEFADGGWRGLGTMQVMGYLSASVFPNPLCHHYMRIGFFGDYVW